MYGENNQMNGEAWRQHRRNENSGINMASYGEMA
jgi:hypothetical protein